MAARIHEHETEAAQHRSISPFKPPAAAAAAPNTPASSRPASSNYYSNTARVPPTKTAEANKPVRLPRANGFAPYSPPTPARQQPPTGRKLDAQQFRQTFNPPLDSHRLQHPDHRLYL